MLQRQYAVLDVFTGTPLEGNQLAVFLDSLDLDASLMQRTAREMNLSETVFLGELNAAPAPGEPHCELRIFTPGTELPFAGHPILGTAFLVREMLGGQDEVRLKPTAGLIPLSLQGEQGEMEQPLPRLLDFPQAAQVLEALGIERPVLGPELYSNGPFHAFIELDSVEAVGAVEPDLGRLRSLGEFGFSVYGPTGEPHRYRSRMFGPGIGVAEDPATGSAAGPLAAHLVRHGRVAPGQQITIEQGVEMGRPSLLQARAEGTPDAITRVFVSGSAVIVARGEYRLA